MHAYLYPGLEAGPQTIRRLIERIEPADLDRPTHPGRFSPREVVAHLADWEPISRGRMQAAHAMPGTDVPDIDEGARALEMGYADWDPIATAEEFIRRRGETIAWLKALAPEDWQKTAVHSVKGEMTIYDYANLELGHDLYHIVQLAEVLAREGVAA